MTDSIRKLIEQLTSDVPAKRNESARALGLWLETPAVRRLDIENYADLLPSDALKNPPTVEDERAVVSALGAVTRSDKKTSTIVWALSKATSVDAAQYIFEVLCTPTEDEELLWQALIGTDNWVPPASADLVPGVRNLIDMYDIRSTLEALRETGSERVRTLSKSILRRTF